MPTTEKCKYGTYESVFEYIEQVLGEYFDLGNDLDALVYFEQGESLDEVWTDHETRFIPLPGFVAIENSKDYETVDGITNVVRYEEPRIYRVQDLVSVHFQEKQSKVLQQ